MNPPTRVKAPGGKGLAYPPDFKAKVTEEAKGARVPDIAKKYNLNDSTVYIWLAQAGFGRGGKGKRRTRAVVPLQGWPPARVSNGYARDPKLEEAEQIVRRRRGPDLTSEVERLSRENDKLKALLAEYLTR